MLKREEEERKYEWVEFEAEVQKVGNTEEVVLRASIHPQVPPSLSLSFVRQGPTGQGLGVVVTENKVKKYLEIKEVLPSIQLNFLSEIAKGNLAKGDVLVGIGKDNITTWPLRRVVQRVGEFRAPTGKNIRLRFRRRCLKQTTTPPPPAIEEEQVVSPLTPSPRTPEGECEATSPPSGK